MRESAKDRLYQGIVTALLCLAALMCMVPLLNVTARSFSSRSASEMNIISLLPVGFTFDSWKFVLSDPALWRSFAISLGTTLAGVALSLAITSLMAYPLSKMYFKPGKILMMYVILTMIFKAPTVPYFLTLRGLGLYNNIFVLILPHILSAYNLAIMRTFFKSFPEEVEDAAKIDGCGCFKTLWSIVLPSSKAVLATVGLFYAVTMWNQFQHPMMFIQKTQLYPLQMKIRQMLNAGADVMGITVRSNANYTEDTLGAATTVFAIVPIIIVYPWLQKYFAKGAMLGSVKG